MSNIDNNDVDARVTAPFTAAISKKYQNSVATTPRTTDIRQPMPDARERLG